MLGVGVSDMECQLWSCQLWVYLHSSPVPTFYELCFWFNSRCWPSWNSTRGCMRSSSPYLSFLDARRRKRNSQVVTTPLLLRHSCQPMGGESRYLIGQWSCDLVSYCVGYGIYLQSFSVYRVLCHVTSICNLVFQQAATSHHLGQNFSKMFEIVFENPAKVRVQH